MLLAVDDGVLTYGDASRRSAELARALLAADIGPHSRVALLFPNGPEFVVSWLALARIGAVSVPLSTFSTSIELLGLLRGADVTLLLATPGYRSHDYVASLSAGMEALDLAAPPPLLAAAAPSLRRIVFAFDGAGGEDLDDGWTLDGLLATASSVRTDVLVAAERAVTPADPHGRRAHLGLHQRTKGCHPQPRRADPASGQPEPDSAGTTAARSSSRTRRSSGSAGSPTPFWGRWSPGPPWSAPTRKLPQPACSTCSSASTPPWSTGSPPRSPTWPRIRRSPSRDLTSIRTRQPLSDHAGESRAGRIPNCITPCSA